MNPAFAEAGRPCERADNQCSAWAKATPTLVSIAPCWASTHPKAGKAFGRTIVESARMRQGRSDLRNRQLRIDAHQFGIALSGFLSLAGQHERGRTKAIRPDGLRMLSDPAGEPVR